MNSLKFAIGLGMIGCELITNLNKRYASDLREKVS